MMPQIPNPYMGQPLPAYGMGMRRPASFNQMNPYQMAQLQRARQAQALQNMPPNLPPDQRYAYAVANHISPSSIGLSNEQINQFEQAQMGQRWSNQAGGMQSTTGNVGGYGKNQDPATGQPIGGGAYGGGGAASATGPNPYGGAAGLYGAGGNALRQQLMDSGQFNPNGSNTYAIQNMDLSGQGASVGQNGQAMGAQTAIGNGSVSGAPMPSAGTSGYIGAPVIGSNPYSGGGRGISGGGLGGGQHSVIQGGAAGGASGLGMGTGTTVNPYNPSAPQTGGQVSASTNTALTTPQGAATVNPYGTPQGGSNVTPPANYGQNSGTVGFGGGQRAHPLSPVINQA